MELSASEEKPAWEDDDDVVVEPKKFKIKNQGPQGMFVHQSEWLTFRSW